MFKMIFGRVVVNNPFAVQASRHDERRLWPTATVGRSSAIADCGASPDQRQVSCRLPTLTQYFEMMAKSGSAVCANQNSKMANGSFSNMKMPRLEHERVEE